MSRAVKKNPLVAPIVKWVGGKRQLLNDLNKLLPKNLSAYTYCEPFFGGGALLFCLQPKKAIINDINEDLMSMYNVVKNNVEELILSLSKYSNDSDTFYKVRSYDRNKEFYSSLSDLDKASRFIYLNKTCYNGLFRVNNAGEFNSPFGNYKSPNIVNAPTLRAVNLYFNQAKIKLLSTDYTHLLDMLPKKAFVYLDPPYDPISSTSNFTGYSRGGFSKDDQIKLREFCDELDRRGSLFMLSNSATEFIKREYSKYNFESVFCKRVINSIGIKRGDVEEVVVRNYE